MGGGGADLHGGGHCGAGSRAQIRQAAGLDSRQQAVQTQAGCLRDFGKQLPHHAGQLPGLGGRVA